VPAAALEAATDEDRAKLAGPGVEEPVPLHAPTSRQPEPTAASRRKRLPVMTFRLRRPRRLASTPRHSPAPKVLLIVEFEYLFRRWAIQHGSTATAG
jgi:hypothetical protein